MTRGSPPHTRGKDHHHPAFHRISGIPPAYAGKSRILDRRKQHFKDHPRIRGEKADLMIVHSIYVGSPPHTRGKGTECSRKAWRCGITPAYAGKRRFMCFLNVCAQDHPRIRGEKDRRRKDSYPLEGSPPHTRGKAERKARWTLTSRITPAYAGKRASVSCTAPRHRDHPRIRGEKLSTKMVFTM